ncbi:hypothetical protein BUALT_BualtUnG0006200 [Buddleja alternifolia]|uniref:Uncharacterized protein n=1 Tax=Buddleja alternifolia TaxID=168488 RepID=A0AAV6W0S6_9LAMI|nr:hypothetical protein BUALT_BualtUnG0006200 [Buddleja alternifolia]
MEVPPPNVERVKVAENDLMPSTQASVSVPAVKKRKILAVSKPTPKPTPKPPSIAVNRSKGSQSRSFHEKEEHEQTGFIEGCRLVICLDGCHFMLETIRMILMKMIHVKRDKMKMCKGELCPNIVTLLEENKKKSMEFIAHWNGHDQFELEGSFGDSHLMTPLHGLEEWPKSALPPLQPPIKENMPRRPKKQNRVKTPQEIEEEKANKAKQKARTNLSLKSTKSRKEEHVEVPPPNVERCEKRKRKKDQDSIITTRVTRTAVKVAGNDLMPSKRSEDKGSEQMETLLSSAS